MNGQVTNAGVIATYARCVAAAMGSAITSMQVAAPATCLEQANLPCTPASGASCPGCHHPAGLVLLLHAAWLLLVLTAQLGALQCPCSCAWVCQTLMLRREFRAAVQPAAQPSPAGGRRLPVKVGQTWRAKAWNQHLLHRLQLLSARAELRPHG